jgi:hypothetical protein
VDIGHLGGHGNQGKQNALITTTKATTNRPRWHGRYRPRCLFLLAWPLSSSFYLLALRSPLLYWWPPLLPLVAELVLDYLVTDMQNVHVTDPTVFLIIVFLASTKRIDSRKHS